MLEFGNETHQLQSPGIYSPHELEYPRETLQSLKKAVKKGGKIVFVEYRAFDPDVPIKPLHTMSVAQAQKEAEDLGLKYEA